MIRFIHTSDWHLGAAFSVLPPDLASARRVEQKKAIEQIADFAISEKVDLFLAAGDIFNSQTPSALDIVFVQNIFSKLTNSGIKVFAIPGTHDAYEAGGFWDKLSVESSASIIFTGAGLQNYALQDFDLTIFGYPYRKANHHERVLKEFANEEINAKNSILLFHGSWENRGIELTKGYPFTTEEINTLPFSYIALGDYHKFAQVGAKAAYSGAPLGLDFSAGELGPKSFILGEIENGKTTVKPIELQTTEFSNQEIDLTTVSPAQLLADLSAQKNSQQYLRVELSGIPSLEMAAFISNLKNDISPYFAYAEIKENLAIPNVAEDESTYFGMYCKKLKEMIAKENDEKRQKVLQKALVLGIGLFNK